VFKYIFLAFSLVAFMILYHCDQRDRAEIKKSCKEIWSILDRRATFMLDRLRGIPHIVIYVDKSEDWSTDEEEKSDIDEIYGDEVLHVKE